MKIIVYIVLVLSILLPSCSTLKLGTVENSSSKRRPDWVEQRPTNTQYYIGVGYASKLSNSGDYQRVAKKNALDDMIGEIKVTVSSNSILSQYQNNQNFNQQFFSDTRMMASETMEGFQVMDSWESKTDYWIYYRMSKADFEAYKRKKLYEATEKALDLMYRADKLQLNSDFIQAFKLRISAAATLQNYLNESIETDYHGKNVFLLNELTSQIQDQLFIIQLKIAQSQIQATSGKSMEYPITVQASLKTKDTLRHPLAYLPLKLSATGILFRGNPYSETQEDGSAGFAISGLQSKDPVQFIQVKPDMERLLRGDSLNASMRKLLLNLEGPSANIKVQIDPIKIYMVSHELNLDKKLNYPILEPALKKKLTDKGCTFVSEKSKADYILELNASTKDQGVMWGNMLKATIELSVVLHEQKSGNEILRDGIEGIQGFQTTSEKAGIEAYRSMSTEMIKKIYPLLEEKLFATEK